MGEAEGTDRVKPATCRPLEPAELFVDLRGKVVYRGDLCEPTAEEWEDDAWTERERRK